MKQHKEAGGGEAMKKITFTGNSWTAPWDGIDMPPDLLKKHPLVGEIEVVNLAQGGAGPGSLNLYQDKATGQEIQVVNGIQQSEMVPEDSDVIIDRLNGNALIAVAIDGLEYELGGTTIELSAATQAFKASYGNDFDGLLPATLAHAFDHDARIRLENYRRRAPQAKVVFVSDWNLGYAPLAKDYLSNASSASIKFDAQTRIFANNNGCDFISLMGLSYIGYNDFLSDGIHGKQSLQDKTLAAIFEGLI